MYINDLVHEVDCEIKMFADDTSLYITVDDPHIAANTLNQNMERVSNWANRWLVNFNAGKTKCMAISNKKINHPSIQFNGKHLKEVDSHKHLGVLISNNLTWSKHVNLLIENSSKMLDILRHFKYKLDRKTLETLYFIFICPKLEYASPIWDDCNEKEKVLLENFQLSAARIVCGAKKGTSHNLIYEETGWPKLSERRKSNKLKFMHKIVQGSSPDYLLDLLPDNMGNKIDYNLRRGNNIRQFKTRTEKFRKSILPDGIRLWNELDNDMKSIDDFHIFEDRIFKESSVNPFYYTGERRINIIHAQLRMQCSNLKAHLFVLHVVENTTCQCSHNIEDSQHFFFECPLYFTHRLRLSTTLQALGKFDLKTILFLDPDQDEETNKIILKAVHKYIKETGRFD